MYISRPRASPIKTRPRARARPSDPRCENSLKIFGEKRIRKLETHSPSPAQKTPAAPEISRARAAARQRAPPAHGAHMNAF